MAMPQPPSNDGSTTEETTLSSLQGSASAAVAPITPRRRSKLSRLKSRRVRKRLFIGTLVTVFMLASMGTVAAKIFGSHPKSSKSDALTQYKPRSSVSVLGSGVSADASGTPLATVSINGDLQLNGNLILSDKAVQSVSESLTTKVNLGASTSVAQVGNIAVTGSIVADTFQGNGINLSDLNASALTSGTISNDLLDESVTKLGQTIPLSALQANVVSSVNGITNNGGDIEIAAGDGITVTSDTTTNKITINSTAATANGDITSVTAGSGLTGGGTEGDITLSLDTSSVTLQGNTFNGISQLVKTDGSGALPSISGVNLTDLDASNINSGTLGDARLSSNVTIAGNSFNGNSQLVKLNSSGALPGVSGINLIDLNASNINSGTLNDSRLSNNVTKQGNTFNGLDQLVKTDGTGALPVLNGANLTSLSASQLTAGMLNDARLSSNVTLQGNTFNTANKLVQLNNVGALPLLSGVNLTNLNASNINSGTLSDSQLSSNVARTNASQTFTGTQTFSGTIVTNSIQPTAGLTIGSTGQALALQGNLSTSISATSGGNTVAIGFTGTPTGSLNYNFDAATTAGTYTICTTVGNCAGSGGGVTSIGGTTNKLAKFTGGQAVGDSSITDTGALVTVGSRGLYKATSDSTSAFQVQNAAGSADVLTVDTTNSRVAIAKSTASYTLDVGGDINSTTGLRVGGNLVCDSTGCIAGASSGFYIQNGTAAQTAANFNIESASNTAPTAILKAKSGQTADILQAKDSNGIVIAKIDVDGNLDVAGQLRIGGSQLSSSALSDVSNLAKLNATQSFTGVNTFQNAVDSTSAFLVQNAAGTSNLLVADTTNSRIGIGTGTPAYMLDVNGDVNISAGNSYRINGVAICGVGTCAPSAGSSNYIQNSTSAQSGANFNIQSVSAGAVTGILRGASSQTANIFEIQTSTPSTVFSVGATGQLLSKNSANSTTAFQIQSATAAPVLVVDTTNTRVAIGQSSASYALDVSGDINASTSIKVGGNTVCTSTGCSASAGSASYIQNGTATQSGNLNVQSANGANPTATLQGAANQSANILQVKDGTSQSNTIFSVNQTTGNVIANSSFESGSTGWSAKGSASISTTTAEKYVGTTSLQIVMSVSEDGAKFAVPLASSTTYYLSYYAKATSSLSAARCGRSDDGTTNVNSTIGPTSSFVTGGWIRYGCSFTTGTTNSNSYVYVGRGSAGGTIYVDGIQLETGSQTAYHTGEVSINGIINTPITLQAPSNSGTALQVLREDGTNGFTVDTRNGTATIGGSTSTLGFGTGASIYSAAGNGLTLAATNGGTTITAATTNSIVTTIQGMAGQTGDLLQTVGGTSLNSILSVTQGNTNLIVNPSFDLNITGWTNINSTSVGRSTADQYSGTGSMQVTTNANAGDGFRQALVTSASTQYTFSFYARSATPFSTLEMGTLAGTTYTSCATGLSLTTTWTRYSCTFTNGIQQTSLYVRQGDAASHVFFVDAFQLEAGSTLTNYSLGQISLNGTVSSPSIFKNVSNSLTAFQIQNASGTGLLVADTTNGRIAIGQSTAAYTLDVAGDINASNTLKVGGNTVCTSTGCTVQAGSGNYIQNGTSTQSANLNIQSASASAVTATIQGASSQSANILDVKDGTAQANKIFSVNQATSNLITNGGFETDTSGWANRAGGVISRTTADKYSGDASLSMAVTTLGDGATYNYPLASSTTYTLSLYAKASSSGLSVAYGRSDDGSTTTACTNMSVGLTWNRYSCTFTTGTVSGTTYLYVALNASATRTIYIDGVQLETGSTATPYSSGNISINGTVISPVNFKNQTDSTRALTFSNAAGTEQFYYDSYNGFFGSASTGTIGTGTGTLQAGSASNGLISIQNQVNQNALITSTRGLTVKVGSTSGTANAYLLQDGNSNSLLSFDTSSTGSSNLITNPSFDASTTGWTALSSTTASRITTDQYAGTGSLSLTTTAATAGIKYPYTFAVSTQYSLSAYVKSAGSSFSTLDLGYSNDGTTYTSCATAQTVTTNWTRVTCTFTTPASGSGSRFVYFRQSDATGRVFYLDAAQLEIASAPSAYSIATIATQGKFISPTVFQNQSNSTDAFKIQNATGTTLLNADTVNNRIAIGQSSASYALDVAGDINTTTAYRVGGTQVCDSTGCTATSASAIQNGTSQQTANFNIKSAAAGSVAATIQGAASGTADLLRVKDGTGTTVSSISNDGSVLLQNSNNSTTALVVRSTAGNDALTVNTGTPAGFGSWTSTTVLPNTRRQGVMVTYNGYAYELGGILDTYTQTAEVRYAPINANGTVGTWSTTTAIAGSGLRYEHSAFAYNGYMYILGGYNNTTSMSEVLYAPINANGTLGSWTATTSMLAGRFDSAVTTYNGYVYVLGGNGVLNGVNAMYAPINANGTIGTWAYTTSFPNTRNGAQAVTNNGYIYLVGGNNGAVVSAVDYAPLNANGTIGTWATTSSFTTGRMDHSAVVSNGALFVLGGRNAAFSAYYNDVQYATFNSNGTLGTFATGASFTTTRFNAQAAAYGNYIYIAGGTGAVDYADVQYASTVLTYSNSVGVGGALSVTGSSTFRNATDSATALSVQNAAGTALLTVDNVNSRVTVGSGLQLSDSNITKQSAGTLAIATAVNGGAITVSAAQGYGTTISGLTSGSAINILRVNSANTANVASTSGTSTGITVDPSFIPASGSGAFVGLAVSPTINQTGSATGDFTALQIRPTITAATGTNKLLIDAGTALNTGQMTLSTTGQFKLKNATDSTTALQVQNSSGVSALTVDSTNMKVIVKNLEVTGHIITSGTTPGIAANAGAGSSPTIGITGTDTAGTITLTTGTSPTVSADVLTTTFATAYTSAPVVVFSPANANAATLTGGSSIFVTPSTTTFVFTTGSSGLTASTQYKWTYHVIQ